ncbi:XrtA/PEP-CTERM system histidine kinase PrsK [Halochromatium roseum]|uniref:XrtA/PEP-CTERM system histidine kinase PrsK n=1 Tax=Halochromatium roseum TaxID=391920 RepID=UPI001912A9DD|nr:XrtA/PEP-CTERM system histidine kinase PrsK [Halochromatium roseum]MBK5940390.1 histidine kinase [Halochromatium roseum]
MLNAATFSYLSALLASSLLFILLLTAWRGRLQGLPAIIGIGSIIIWAAIYFADTAWDAFPEGLVPYATLARNAGLFLLLTSALASSIPRTKRIYWYSVLISILSATLVFGILPQTLPLLTALIPPTWSLKLLPYFWLLQAVFGLLLIEQVVRNYPQSQLWSLKHLCLGLGVIFAYDLFFFSDSVLLNRVDLDFLSARGFVTAIAIPLIAVSVARNPAWSLDIHVSRSVVFHSATLLGSGLYLIAMAVAGYYIRASSGAWGATLQIVFLFAAVLFLITLLFSGHIRARLKILLSEHFFSFKYDYRSEWSQFTESLAATNETTPKAIIHALSGLVKSPGGFMWINNGRGSFECIEKLKVDSLPLPTLKDDDPLIQFIRNTGWIVDLSEMRSQPEAYPEVDAPNWSHDWPELWLIIPLFFQTNLIGCVALTRSAVIRHVNWEDRSLLKTAGLQAAGMLAQFLSDQALMSARQFEAFNQLAAYVAHDLKNLIAQQSLIVTNAERHKDNPEFINDVIHTVKNSVERMERLMIQLRHGKREEESTRCSLDSAVTEAICRLGSTPPIPSAVIVDHDLFIQADEERLITSLGHLLKNAREATSSNGSVDVEVLRKDNTAIIRISDDGVGMSQDFIRERLFKPFDSTKGLTGMGVGAFESRQFFYALGGELTVDSKPGAGSVFTIHLPMLAEPEVANALPQTEDCA